MLTVDFSRLAVFKGARVLDIGCGTGRHTAEALRYNGVEVTAVDLRMENLYDADKRVKWLNDLGECQGRLHRTAADIVHLPFQDSSFDLVICAETLEHVLADSAAADELARVLKPNGQMAVSVPRYGPEYICWRLSNTYRHAADGHVRIYRKHRLKQLMETAGLKMTASHSAHSLHSPYWWLKCLVGPERENAKIVNLYHRFLVWDIMAKPRFIRLLDRLLNPILGKSLVIYLRKPSHV